ncbi:MAG: diguanylate cyclase (GGDEF)-like protein/PAS domain S-box-containing protein [Paracoccaceae bacterium]|jgi:diguanylate cyclase (GGDEF)-like protein/PAS domain S-box-containing protein
MIRRGSTTAVSRRFWTLITATFCVAVISTASVVWLTATPILREMQDDTVVNTAHRSADSLAAALHDHRQFLTYLSKNADVIALTVGNTVDASQVRDMLDAFDGPAGLLRVRIFDFMKDLIATHGFAGDEQAAWDAQDLGEIVGARLDGTGPVDAVAFRGDAAAGRFLITVPIRYHGLVEGVLMGEVSLNLSDLVPSAGLITSPNIMRSDRLRQMHPLDDGRKDLIAAPVGETGLSMVMVPNRAAVSMIGAEILTNVTLAVSLTLLLPFGLFALVGRAAIIAPHDALQRSREQLREKQKSLAELALIAEMAKDAIAITDLESRIKWVNPAFELMTGYSAAELAGKVPSELLRGDGYEDNVIDEARRTHRNYSQLEAEVMNVKKDGTPYWISISLSPLADPNGVDYGHITIARDITERRRHDAAMLAASREVEHQALHDPLTSLPNRRFLDREIERRRVDPDHDTQTLVRIDLDHFKYVNDTLGHAAGDFVLCQVAAILRDETKAEDLAARVGGDEFVVLLAPRSTSQDGAGLATRLLGRIRQEMDFDGAPCRIGASFGVVSTSDKLVEEPELLISADAALYIAKEEGRNRVVLYTPAVHAVVVQNRMMATEIEEAIETEQFVPYYQPQFHARTRAFAGLEALVRWPNPKRGLLKPAAFLPLAEKLSVVPQIDAVMLRKGLAEVAGLSARGVTIPKLSFNVTAARIESAGLIDVIRAHGRGPTQVALEILESVLIEDQGAAFGFQIDMLRELGVAIEVDDFGSGHTSILGLMQLSPDVMKIDQRLIAPLPQSEVAAKMVRAVIEIGRALDIKVMAEGVETARHAEMLAEMGCDYLQGYHFARPMPGEALERYLRGLTEGPNVLPREA